MEFLKIHLTFPDEICAEKRILILVEIHTLPKETQVYNPTHTGSMGISIGRDV